MGGGGARYTSNTGIVICLVRRTKDHHNHHTQSERGKGKEKRCISRWCKLLYDMKGKKGRRKEKSHATAVVEILLHPPPFYDLV